MAFWTLDCGLQFLDCGLWIVDWSFCIATLLVAEVAVSELQFLDCGLQFVALWLSRLWNVDCDFWTS